MIRAAKGGRWSSMVVFSGDDRGRRRSDTGVLLCATTGQAMVLPAMLREA
jgi:hypothetical protein